MRAIVIDTPNAPPQLREVPEPNLPAHGALIEVRATGVCRSDWHAWVGHDPTVAFPHVPGHEFAGVVRALGRDVHRDLLGARVTAPFCCGCGSCGRCQSGHEHLCDREYQPGFDGWGSFAELVMVPWADVNLARLPDSVSFEAAAALGCRFMTSFHGLVDLVRVQPGERVVVFGAGGIGLSAVAIAAAHGAEVTAVDLNPEKLALAKDLGATHGLLQGGGDVLEGVRALTGGGPEISVDAVGSAAVARQAIEVLRPKGRHLQLGLLLAADADPSLPLQRVVRRELSVHGGHGMPASAYPRLFEFIARHPQLLNRLIGRRRPLAEAGEALTAMGSFEGVGVTLLLP
jgi:alcohol dehydrogenase